MENLRAFLAAAKTTGPEFNFVSLRGGKFLFKDIPRLLSLHVAAQPFDQGATCLAWKPPRVDHHQLTLDFDLRLSEDELIDTFEFVHLAERLCLVVAETTKVDSFSLVLTRKLTNYPKREKNKPLRWASGFHLYFLNLLVTKAVALKIRTEALDLIAQFKLQVPVVVNEPTDILDTSVSPLGSNGIILVGDKKPQSKTGGAHHIVFRGQFDGSSFKARQSFEPEETPSLLTKWRAQLFGHLWGADNGWLKVGTIEEEKAAPSEKNGVGRADPTVGFNLKAFLAATSDHVPTNAEYKQIIFFCASLGMDPQYVASLCNAAWAPSDPGETARLFDSKRPGYDAISQGSMVRFLNEHAGVYDHDLIFPRRLFRFYNEGLQFAVARGKVWDPAILRAFCRDVFAYSASEDKYVFKNRIRMTDNHGNEFNLIETAIKDKPPFCGNDALLALVKRSEDELMAMFAKKLPKKVDLNTIKLLELKHALPGMTPSARIKALEEVLKLPPKRVALGDIFLDQMKCGFVRWFDKLVFKPFLHKDNTPPNVFNTFAGFPLRTYRPTKYVPWRETAVYTWLWEVYAHQDEEKMKKLLLFLAWFIQNPATRSERIWVIFGRAHGSGKTSAFSLLVSLTSTDLGVFYLSMEEFLSPFNASSANKRILFIDDIGDSSAKQAKRLHALATAKVQRYNAKHEKPFTLNCCGEIFISSNDPTPIFIRETDRRCGYFNVADTKAQNRVFFKKVYAAIGDMNCMKTLFDELSTMELGDYAPTPDNDLDPGVRTDQKVGCMNAVWSFVATFFADEGWMGRFRSEDHTSWEYEVSTLKQRCGHIPANTVRIRIVAPRFFSDFKRWNRASNTGKTYKETYFWKTVADLGIVPKKRQRFKDKIRTIVDVYFKEVKKALQGHFTGFKMTPWPTEDPELRNEMVKDAEPKHFF